MERPNLLAAPVSFTFEGKEYAVTVLQGGPRDWREKKFRSNLYMDPKHKELRWTDILGEEPAYSIRGEDKDLDRAWDKYNRRLVSCQRAALEALKAAEVLDYSKASFSRYAGCTCPCSPGWNMTDLKFQGMYATRWDVWCTFTSAEVAEGQEFAAQLQAAFGIEV
jgi:hypothetical protein